MKNGNTFGAIRFVPALRLGALFVGLAILIYFFYRLLNHGSLEAVKKDFCAKDTVFMQYGSVYKSLSGNGSSTSDRQTRSTTETSWSSSKSSNSMISSLNAYLNSKPSSYPLHSSSPDMQKHRGIPFPSTIHGSPYVADHHFPRPGNVIVRSSLIKASDAHPMISPQLNDRLLQLADRSRRLGVHRYSRSRHSLVLNEPVISRRSPPPMASTIANRFYTSDSSKAPVLSKTYRPYRE